MSFFNADIRVTGSDGLVLKDLGTNATTPGSGLGTLYLNSGQVYIRNSSGTDTSLSSGGGGGGSTAADDITVGDSTVNLSTTSGNIIMHSVSNASNSIVMTSNSGASETIEIHNVQGTSSSSILLNSHSGGVKLEGKSTNKDNVSNLLEISSSQPTSNGSGFNPKYFSSFTNKAFGEIITTFQIDAENLLVASSNNSNANSIIGTNNSTDAYFGRYNSSTMGNLYKLECICVETPTPEIATSTDVGIAYFNSSYEYGPFTNLSNGTTYTVSGGDGSGAEVTFDLTTNGFLKQIFLVTAGSGYNSPNSVQVTPDGGPTYQFYYVINYYTSEKKITTQNTYGSGNPVGTTIQSSGSGSGLTVNVLTFTGSNYIYGVSIVNEGSDYNDGDILQINSGSLYLGVKASTLPNLYGLGANASILSTSSETSNITAGQDSVTNRLDLASGSNIDVISNNDYLYLTYHGTVSSNTTITGGKYLIKMYGTDF